MAVPPKEENISLAQDLARIEVADYAIFDIKDRDRLKHLIKNNSQKITKYTKDLWDRKFTVSTVKPAGIIVVSRSQ